MITVAQEREWAERRGADAGEQDNVLDCPRCSAFYVEGEYHHCRRTDGVGWGWAT